MATRQIRMGSVAVLLAALAAAAPAHAGNCTTTSAACTLSGAGTNTEPHTLTIPAFPGVNFDPNNVLPPSGLLYLDGAGLVPTCVWVSIHTGDLTAGDGEFFITAVTPELINGQLTTWYIRLYKNPGGDMFAASQTPALGSRCDADLVSIFPSTGTFSVTA